MDARDKIVKRVLVTGASGFLGQSFLKQACKNPNFEFFAVISGRREVAFQEGITVVKANLLEHQQIEELINNVRPDIIYHFAWGLEKQDFVNAEENLDWLMASTHLLRAFINKDGKRFVFAGSSAEYGYQNNICREGESELPSDLYGITKKAFSDVALHICRQMGISCAIARIFSVYGSGEDRLVHTIPVAISAFLSGNSFICKAPNNVWDYIYIDDAVHALVGLTESDFSGIVNIATGKPCVMRNVFEEIASQLECCHLLYFENENEEGRMLVADTSILTNTLGIACNTSLKRGIAQTINWWKIKKCEV